jgi:holo-[acyl-carrier protein] synthase
MIKGIGIDLVSISLFSEKLENKAFIKKTFSSLEIESSYSHNKFAERFAGKFAAKEAFMKAIGKGIRQEVWFNQIEVLNHETGAPYFKISGKAQEFFAELGIGYIHLSISHDRNSAVAIVILESK